MPQLFRLSLIFQVKYNHSATQDGCNNLKLNTWHATCWTLRGKRRQNETERDTGLVQSATHLTFDCGNLSLHLHWLIFSTQVGSCHGIKFSCHYMGPPVLLLSHYPIALARVHTCVSVGHEENSYTVFGTGPSLHTIKVPLIKSCPQITHLHSQVYAVGPNHTQTHTYTHMVVHRVVNAMLGFLSANYLSIRHVHIHTHSFALICPQLQTPVIWHFLQSLTVRDTVYFPMWALQPQKWEPTFLASHTPNFCPPAPSLITGSPSGLPEVFFYFISVCMDVNELCVCVCAYMQASQNVCVLVSAFTSVCCGLCAVILSCCQRKLFCCGASWEKMSLALLT